MRSLAEVTIIGMVTVVVMAYYLPPLIFRWLTEKHGKRREYPVTLRRLAASVFSMAFFICGMYGVFIPYIYLVHKPLQRVWDGEHFFHRLLQRIAHFVIRHVPGRKFHQLAVAGVEHVLRLPPDKVRLGVHIHLVHLRVEQGHVPAFRQQQMDCLGVIRFGVDIQRIDVIQRPEQLVRPGPGPGGDLRGHGGHLLGIGHPQAQRRRNLPGQQRQCPALGYHHPPAGGDHDCPGLWH